MVLEEGCCCCEEGSGEGWEEEEEEEVEVVVVVEVEVEVEAEVEVEVGVDEGEGEVAGGEVEGREEGTEEDTATAVKGLDSVGVILLALLLLLLSFCPGCEGRLLAWEVVTEGEEEDEEEVFGAESF